MATQEKLLKSLESLRKLLNSNLTTDISLRKKEKIHHCNVITETIGNPTIRIAPNFTYLLGFSIEVLLQLCDDPESDVRMIVDECLNRIIRAMSDGNISKIQIELHKEIKKNGSPRSLRAALWRFSELAHHIRPHKGKPYVSNLMPCIIKTSERDEEMVHETLANSLPKIMMALGCFTTDNDIKSLLKAFLNNIPNTSAVIRRTTASSILTICLNCRKPYVFITYVLNSLLDMLIPIQEGHTLYLILGVMGCLKVILPFIKNSNGDQEIKGSFGVRMEVTETPVAVDRLLQVYELCLHYILDNDHNVINASLETLNVLLQHSSTDLKSVLLSPNGLGDSRISFYDTSNKLKQRSPSQLSIATTSLSGEDTLESELMDSLRPDIEKWIDESKLSVLNVTYARTSEIIEKQFLRTEDQAAGEVSTSQTAEYSNISIGPLQGNESESITCDKSIGDNLDKLVLSETSSEKSFTQHTDDKSILMSNSEIIYQEIDIGDFKDKSVSLLYCTRLIIKLFLLNGCPGTLIPDKFIRVSVKSLSLNCLATILDIYPEALAKSLDKNDSKANRQQISDVLLFKDHVDPQLRGIVRILIGNFLRTVLTGNNGDYESWLTENIAESNREIFQLKHLITIMINGLDDESSNCCKQSLQGLSVCFKYILESQCSLLAVPILNALPLLARNPYWLVKATLVEVISNIHYVTTYHITNSNEFQDKVIHNIFFELLKDEDKRVRAACSSALVQVLPLLYFKQHIPNESTVTNKAKYYRNLYQTCGTFKPEFEMNLNKKQLISNMPFPFNQLNKVPDNITEEALSRIIWKLTNSLLTSKSKYFIFGCIETLCLLSEIYPPTIYFNAWNCFKNFNMVEQHLNSDKELVISSSMGLFSICINLLCNGSMGYDINCHLNLLKLAGNLFAGTSIQNLKPKTDITLEDTTQLWDMFSDKNLSNLTEQFVNHILKLLNIFYHVMEEIVPVQPQNKPVLPNLPSAAALSPIKRRKSDIGEKTKTISAAGKITDKEEKAEKKNENLKSNLIGSFANLPHYLKIYDLLRTAYTNYKTTLDSEASEKFVDLLKVTLQTLSQLLELATLLESGRISEEILSYFRSTFNLEPSSTVACVQQLLKSLFGTNLTCTISDIYNETGNNNSKEEENRSSFYHSIFQRPYDEYVACINSFTNSVKVDHDGDKVVMGYLHRKENKKSSVLPRGTDKILANYIRLFEPMVIKSLKQYTITSDIKLQCKVLQLLCQLVQLRVNYCLLDSEQIFIGFVLKQFEYIEEGQILLSDELIPRIFNFLVHLSYGKQHSKSIIGIPKVIQLCDGLMASGQPPLTHCIPALEPVIEDIFLFRNKSNTSDFKELETTREVLLSMLLRLLEYHDVLNLLTFILNESKYCTDNTDKWLKWSKQVADVFLPMLKQNRIAINNQTALVALRKLISILNPSVFKPLNDVLLILFDDPPYTRDSIMQVNRWLGKVHALLIVASQSKEELLLLKILEVQSDFAPRSVFHNISMTADPLNVTNTSEFLNGIRPEIIFVRYIFCIIDIVTENCAQLNSAKDDLFLIEQFSSFLMFCLHIFQSGSHCKIANTAVRLANVEFQADDGEEPLPIENINKNMLKLAIFFPTLTFEWCYLLTLLNYNDRKFWSVIIQITKSYGIVNQLSEAPLLQKSHCINLEIVRFGGTIVFCDYLNENMNDGEQLSWFLVNNIELLVRLCNEEPVYEFLCSLHRNSSASGLVIQAITTKCLPVVDQPTFRAKILKCIENVHPSQVGALLCLLLPKLLNCPQLALSHMIANLASRKIELLLMMSMEEVNSQLPKEDLMQIMDSLVETKLVKKHEALVSLLNKLATQYYDLSPLEFDQRRTVNPEYIKKLQINKAWYISQVKSKSQGPNVGSELAKLLSCLDYGDLLNIMSNKDFNKEILKDCIAWGMNKIAEDRIGGESCLLKASINMLTKDVAHFKNLLPKQHHIYKVVGRAETVSELKYSSRLGQLLSDDLFWAYLYDLIPSVTYYIESLSSLPPTLTVPENHLEDFIKFSVSCLESINFLITSSNGADKFNVNCIDLAVNCAMGILKNIHLHNFLTQDSHVSWLCSAINSIYKLVTHLLLGGVPLPDIPKCNLMSTDNADTLPARHACYQLSTLIVWLERVQNSIVNIPNFLFNPIKSIIVSLSRLPLVNSYLLTPPSAWRNGFNAKLSGTFNTQVPPLPIEFLQEVDILEEFIYRITLLGWTSRQQFEETWMCLLSVLSSSPTEDSLPEEVNAIIHVTSLAVQAITSLLLQTLCSPILGNADVSQILHVSRDLQIEDNNISIKRLRNVHNKLQYKFNQHSRTMRNNSALLNVFNKSNLEKMDSKYSLGQLSVEYLLISAKSVESVDETRIAAQVYATRQKILEESGLDLNSCLKFLIDLYSQWIKAQNTPLRILYEVVKSVLVISDLFTEKSQFAWMLEVFLDLSKVHTSEDEILQQYLVIGVCKAAAILTPDMEVYESVKKLIVQNLKSGFLPSKIASLHGILYLLQGNILGNTCIGGLSDEMQLIFPTAIEYIQCHINSNNGVLNQCPEHSLLIWAISFYLIENVEDVNFTPDFIPTVIQAAITYVSLQKVSSVCNATLKGLERLVVKQSVPVKIRDQLVKLSLEKMKSIHPTVAIPAVQVLLSCLYMEQSETSQESGSTVQSNPDNLVQTIEKISAIFDHIKRGFPFEVEILCSILPDILNDFFPPSDILTKVLGEFLSPQQPHPKLLSLVVFKVFQSAIEQSQLSLLQDWVVFSLSNFTQSFSIGMATWCLTCFFISASTNEWLRSLFPYVQSRVGRYEYEDRKILCIAGTDFYKNLTNDKQKEAFVSTFTKVKGQMDTPFNELLASL